MSYTINTTTNNIDRCHDLLVNLIILESLLVLLQIYVTNLVVLQTFLVIHYSTVNMIRIVKNISKPIQ